MNYIIFKDGAEVNRIVADEAFCRKYCAQGGCSYEPEPPRPAPEPEAPLPTAEEDLMEMALDHELRLTMLELGV